MLKSFIAKWFFLLILLTGNLIIGLRTGLEFFHFFFWLLLAILGIGLIWLFLQYYLTSFTITRRILGKIEEEDILNIELDIQNQSFFPVFNLMILDHLACAEPKKRDIRVFVDYVGIKSRTSIKYHCFCPLRGRYILKNLKVYFFDPFGLFFFRKTYPVYSEAYVYPKTFRIDNFPPLTRGVMPWFGIETARVSGDDDEFYGIREYKYGDPIKKIHWFSSARLSKLIVKQFQRQNFYRATIMFDLEKDKNLGEGKESICEYMVKIAASVAKYLVDKDISVEIIAHAGELVHIPFNKGQEHLEDILKFLTIAQAESRVSLAELFEEYSRYIAEDSSLIVIMLDTDWEYVPEILSLDKRNVSLVPLILFSSTFLYSFDKHKAVTEIENKPVAKGDLRSIYVSCGDNLEDIFNNIKV